jgi:hypothetical protein
LKEKEERKKNPQTWGYLGCNEDPETTTWVMDKAFSKSRSSAHS